MKVVLVIDHLGPGGAQRQLCWLARLLVMSDYEVVVVTYYPQNFFLEILQKDGNVRVIKIDWTNQLQRIGRLRRVIDQEKAGVVVSFLKIPSMLCVIARILGHKFRLIVSERDHDVEAPDHSVKLRFYLYRFADRVVSNSYAQANYIKKYAPWLKVKLEVITNMVDLDFFEPCRPCYGERPRFVGIGRVIEQKNCLRLVEAVVQLYQERDIPRFSLCWYGSDMKPNSGYMEEIKDVIIQNKVEDVVAFQPAVKDIRQCYNGAAALCLPSLHEGCPNVVGEAMAAGIPVIGSRSGDTPRLLDEGLCGILFDGTDVESIATALRKFLLLPHKEKEQLGIKARDRAGLVLSKDRFLSEWLKVVES